MKSLHGPETFRRFGEQVTDGAAVLVTGRVEVEAGKPTKIIAEAAEPLAGIRERHAKGIILRFPADSLNTAQLEKLRDLIDAHRGERPLTFVLTLADGVEVYLRPQLVFSVRPSLELVAALQASFPNCTIELQ